jgi:hypothetical protein
MNADTGDEIEIDLTNYVEPPDLDAAWALVLADLQSEEAEGEAVAAAPDPDPDPVSDELPPDFDQWTTDRREAWAYDPDLRRSASRERQRLYAAYLTLHPEHDILRHDADQQGDRTEGRTHGQWLTNAVNADAWDDSTPPTPPTVCRIDGTVGALFAAGRTSRLFGSSGSAKSWIAKLGTLEVLSSGGSVLYLDGDGIWQDFRDHMKAMGLSRDDALSGRLHYSRVEGSLLGDDFRLLLDSRPWSFIVVDGYNRALGGSGFKGNEDPDVNAFSSAVLDPAAAAGAAVVVIDHMKKDGETDHGSVFKRNNLSGSDYAIKRQSLIAPGLRGFSSITLTDKDRPGWATQLQGTRGRTKDDAFAHVIVDSTGDSGVATVVTLQLDAPGDVLIATAMTQANNDADTLRDLLNDYPAGFASNAKLRTALKARGKDMDNSRINNAAAVLQVDGLVTRTRTGQSFDLRPVTNGGGQP